MPTTHYLGFTKAGHAVARKSQSDYGYTHAAVRLRDNGTPEKALPNFSTTAQGALRNMGTWWIEKGYPYEIVAVSVVDAATYRKATGKR